MKLTIWLEIHLKLATQAKVYCGCRNSQDFDNDTPNTYVCPTCTAQPGALPVVNHEAIIKALELGKVLWCIPNPHPTRDRKSYFYPDSPVGYQITQALNPINGEWSFSFWNSSYTQLHTISIQQAHLENDTAKTIHMDSKAYLDFNRCGTPLVEIVTRPNFHSADEVTDFLKELQRIVKWNNIAYADLEKGQMRVDVNLSVSPDDTLGTRVEIKNMNSFSAIRRAIDYEYNRHVAIIQAWWHIDQATVGWDDAKTETYMMRSKEDSMDYRYFPEPDLPALDIHNDIANLTQCELIIPSQEIKWMVSQWFNKEYINALTNDLSILHYFKHILEHNISPHTIAKWMTWLMMGQIQIHWINGLKFTQGQFIEFCTLNDKWSLSDHHAKTIIEHMINSGKSASDLIHELGFDQQSDIDLLPIITQVVEANPKVLEDYKWWKPSAAWFFIWQVMKATAGKCDPRQVKAVVEECLITYLDQI